MSVQYDENGTPRKAPLSLQVDLSKFSPATDEEKRQQEQASLNKVNDSFKKIIITGEECIVHRNNYGITTMSIYDFLLQPNALEL